MKRAGIQDVAREAGVSKSSVSNYLNGKDARLSEATKTRIREAAARLQYTPSLGARRLSTKTASRTIGAVIRHDLGYLFQTRFFSQIMRGIGEACGPLGYRVLLVSSHGEDLASEVDYALSLSRGIVDGFLLFELEENDPYLAAFERAQVPYLCFGRPEDPSLTRWVASDQQKGIELAAEHLLSRGASRIALFPGRRGSLVAKHRADGWRAALSRAGLAADESLLRFSYAADADAYPEFLSLLGPGGPDAFILPQAQLPSYRRALAASGREANAPDLVLADYFPADEWETTDCAYVKGHVRQVGLRGAARLIESLEGRLYGAGETFPTELVPGAGPGRDE